MLTFMCFCFLLEKPQKIKKTFFVKTCELKNNVYIRCAQ